MARENSRLAAIRDGNSPAGKAKMAAIGRANRIHGLTSHPLFGVWCDIIKRCENPGYKQFADYGGRGIQVCERWHDVQLFIEDIEREIGPRPEGRTESSARVYWSLDRKDNDGNYESGNVRWTTYSVQRTNQRRMKHGHRSCGVGWV